MNKLNESSPSTPNLSRMESKQRTTDKVSRAIIEEEKTKRERKTERLRSVRLAREAEEQARAPSNPSRKRKAPPRAKPAGGA